MKETELNKVLNYMKQYVENKYEHDSEPILNWKDLKIVLDYITYLQNTEDLYNQLLKDYDELQQENNNLKTSLDESQEVVIDLQQENERLKELNENYPIEEELAESYRREEDYKSRINKAIEYIENSDKYDFSKCELLDILKGSDKE